MTRIPAVRNGSHRVFETAPQVKSQLNLTDVFHDDSLQLGDAVRYTNKLWLINFENSLIDIIIYFIFISIKIVHLST